MIMAACAAEEKNSYSIMGAHITGYYQNLQRGKWFNHLIIEVNFLWKTHVLYISAHVGEKLQQTQRV